MTERRTSPVELLWDLVFVFAVTEVSTLIAKHLTWTGFAHGMIALALVWWAWSAFVWAANAEDEQSRALLGILLLAMALAFVAGLALPSAFGSEAMLFAVAYAGVRFLHLGMYAHAARRGHAAWSAIYGFAVTVAVGMALLLAGALIGGGWQVALWLAALAIDYAGPAWLTRERLRGLQAVAVAHFAERYGLFVIICLGESIVAIGLSAERQTIDARLVTAVALGLVITIGLWWTYFDRLAGRAEERLRGHDDVVLAAADSYSYIHLPVVAGIIVFAVGMRITIDDVSASLSDAARLALCGGLALYLVGVVAFQLRMVRTVGWARLAGAAALLGLFATGGAMSSLWLTAVAAALVAAVCAVETLSSAGR